MENMLKSVEKIMDEASSLEELKDNLIDAFSDMDAAALGILIQKAMTTADLMGRYEVDTDA